MRTILVFDDIQRKDAQEQAKSMKGSDQPLNECIEFGRDWAKVGLAFARQDYEATKKLREIRERVEREESA
jgi:hypothetical protein